MVICEDWIPFKFVYVQLMIDNYRMIWGMNFKHDNKDHVVENNKSIVMVLLYLSAAFDAVDRIVQRLFWSCSLADQVISWRLKYLYMCGPHAHDLTSLYGILQGSVNGLMLFTFYFNPLGDFSTLTFILLHNYDIQMHLLFDPTNPASNLILCSR